MICFVEQLPGLEATSLKLPHYLQPGQMPSVKQPVGHLHIWQHIGMYIFFFPASLSSCVCGKNQGIHNSLALLGLRLEAKLIGFRSALAWGGFLHIQQEPLQKLSQVLGPGLQKI